jgi:hypothetical protein
MTSHTRAIVTAAILIMTAVLAAGCGITNPYQHPAARTATHTATTAATSTTTTAPAATTTAAAATTAPAAASSPQAALTAYATGDINWTSATVGVDQRHLAAISVGAARATALQAAATYGAGSQLQDSKVTNHGQITSIAAGQGPLAGEWVVTTAEKTAGVGDYQGLPAQAHVYYARVQHTTTGYRVSQWSPQS